MQNKERKRSTGKKGAMVILSLCLVGGAAFTTYYTMNRAEKAKEEQQKLMDLNAEIQKEAKEKKPKRQRQVRQMRKRTFRWRMRWM